MLAASGSAIAQESERNCTANQAAMSRCAELDSVKANLDRMEAFGELVLLLGRIETQAGGSTDREEDRDIPLQSVIAAETAWTAHRDAECFKGGALSGGSLGITQRAQCHASFNSTRAQNHRALIKTMTERFGIK
jgi:uncharacterized protein YecT (DUF1311 family)